MEGHRIHRGLASVCVVALTAGLAHGQDPSAKSKPPAPGGPPSLDQQLSDELDRELLQDLPPASRPATGKPGGAKPAGPPAKPASDLDLQLLEQLGDGEDLGQKSPDPLTTISRRMRAVEARMSRHDTAETTQRLQQQIVADLALLIEQAQKQCSGGQGNKSGKPKPGSKPGSGKKGGTGENVATNRQIKEGPEAPEQIAKTKAEFEALKALPKDLWGHLPPRLREQIRSGLAEQFLPKYQQLIEAYYRRLAEERSE